MYKMVGSGRPAAPAPKYIKNFAQLIAAKSGATTDTRVPTL